MSPSLAVPATTSPTATATSSPPSRASTTTGRLVQSRPSGPKTSRSAAGHLRARKPRTSLSIRGYRFATRAPDPRVRRDSPMIHRDSSGCEGSSMDVRLTNVYVADAKLVADGVAQPEDAMAVFVGRTGHGRVAPFTVQRSYTGAGGWYTE